ncbi:electron transfer flavoprotein subunit alpha/FixB family protein, partial [bacterium]|nr:electron transfer flavoprotein subunit alpha/FixB family protein [bacterium]
RMIAPRLAMRLQAGLVADVTAINREGNELLAIRPAYSGRMLASIRFAGEGPVMMSIRPGVFHSENSGASRENSPVDWTTRIEPFVPRQVRDGKIRRLSVTKKEQIYDIRESDVLVSGGGGVIGKFHHLERLARKLGGQVSASRKIVDQGSAPRSIQVGQSGKRVSPKLYIALGINGAIQHVEGLKQVEHIISVNINKDAPICSLSDIVVEGDAVTFIEKLVHKIEEESGSDQA